MKETILYDSTYMPDYTDYCEFCEVNQIEPQNENSKNYWDFVDDCQQIYYDDFFSNVQNSDVNLYAWMISGYVGRWDGQREICQTLATTLSDAIKRCSKAGNDFIVKKTKNKITMEVIDHDGRSFFVLNPLSAKGEQRFYTHGKISLKNKENIAKLPLYIY